MTQTARDQMEQRAMERAEHVLRFEGPLEAIDMVTQILDHNNGTITPITQLLERETVFDLIVKGLSNPGYNITYSKAWVLCLLLLGNQPGDDWSRLGAAYDDAVEDKLLYAIRLMCRPQARDEPVNIGDLRKLIGLPFVTAAPDDNVAHTAGHASESEE